MKLVRLKLVDVPLNRILTNVVQPVRTNRTGKLSIQSLQEMVEETRFLDPPTLEPTPGRPGWYTALDGHRRLAVALAIGESHVQCIVRPAACNVTFVKLNGRTRAMLGSDYGEIWAKSETPEAELRDMPKGAAQRIRLLAKIVGPDVLRRYFQAGKLGPNVIQYIERLIQLFRDLDLRYDKRDVALFVMSNPIQGDIRRAYSQEKPAKYTQILYKMYEQWVKQGRCWSVREAV